VFLAKSAYLILFDLETIIKRSVMQFTLLYDLENRKSVD